MNFFGRSQGYNEDNDDDKNVNGMAYAANEKTG